MMKKGVDWRLMLLVGLGALLGVFFGRGTERHPMTSSTTVAVAEAWSYLKPMLKKDSQKNLSNYEYRVDQDGNAIRVSFWPKVVAKGRQAAVRNTDLAIDVSVLLNGDLTFNRLEADV